MIIEPISKSQYQMAQERLKKEDSKYVYDLPSSKTVKKSLSAIYLGGSLINAIEQDNSPFSELISLGARTAITFEQTIHIDQCGLRPVIFTAGLALLDLIELIRIFEPQITNGIPCYEVLAPGIKLVRAVYEFREARKEDELREALKENELNKFRKELNELNKDNEQDLDMSDEEKLSETESSSTTYISGLILPSKNTPDLILPPIMYSLDNKYGTYSLIQRIAENPNDSQSLFEKLKNDDEDKFV